ncbi:response regulator [Aurantimonas marianensis]|uniref:Response regulator n=1 Tax=Aurantimonas marianensis TaxID=2920428 RepID=A0A9X2H217_9HYPH|nr:response regulator [Aurantimonas marianensis]MCP3053827.1 response regulator [Aurantimonas marianensis]
MLASDGFWGFLSTIVIASILVYILEKFFPDLKKILEGRHVSIKIFGQELSVQKATHQIGDWVTELQNRVAALESGSANKNENKITDGKPNFNVNINNSPEKRILWVDDFPSNNAFIMENLKGRDLQVEISLSTEDALKKFTALDHSLIITDLGRIEGEQDNPYAGLELIKRIRALNETVPIMVFAGKRGLQMRDELISSGATEVTSSGIDVMKFINSHMAT